jgi:ankyrin repeat protein
MKSIFTTFLLLLTFTISSQEIPLKIKDALKKDDAKTLKKKLTKENINKCYEAGNANYSLLILAIKLNSKECFNKLVNQKADLDKDCGGKTPLIYTAKYGRLEMAKKLIVKGASLEKKYSGRTALDYAKKYQKKEVLDYLSSLEN